MLKNHSISLIIITMNRRDELRKTLISLKEQDTDIELIIVDNGSKDGSSELVRRYCPEAVIIELDANKGVSGGRNEGIRAATGDILVFLDDDASFANQDTMSRIRKRFEDDPNLGILAMNSYLTATGKPETAAIPRRVKKIFEKDYQSSYFCGVGFAFRRDIIKEVGYFYEGYFYSCEELDLSWRAIERGYRILWAADIVVWHRISLSARKPGRWFYTNARNRVWLAIRHLPWRYVISYGILWWGFLLVKSIRNNLLRDFIKGIVDCFDGLPKILKERRILSDTTIKIIRDCNGRLLY